MQLVIGNKNYSSWSLRPWILLRHAELKFDEVHVPLFTSKGNQMLGDLSPSGKVPVLHTDGFVLWDSLAICEYLADRHPEKKLWPTDQQARAHARAICSEMHSGFNHLRESMPMNCRKTYQGFQVSPDTEQDIGRIKTILTEALDNYSSTTGWLYGDYGIGDAMYAPVVSRFHTYGVQCAGKLADYCEKVLEDTHLVDWYQAAELETEIIEKSEMG